jgi:hypothetical protein
MSEIYDNIIKNNYFVTPKELQAEYYKSIDLGNCSPGLLNLFTIIAKKFAIGNYEYINKIDFDACVNYAICEAYYKWDKFDEKRSNNIFSFYTTMLANDIKLHYKHITRGKKLTISIDSLFSSENK